MTEEHTILKYWLRGSTCTTGAGNGQSKRSILAESDTHIILKHGAHPSYSGRMYGSGNCGSYAKLYDKSAFTSVGFRHSRAYDYGDGQLLKWEGRLNLKKILADCAAIGVTFPQKA